MTRRSGMIATQRQRYTGRWSTGDAEECGCTFCENFAIQRELIYPASFRALLEQLGVDPNKEGEIFECGPVKRMPPLWRVVLFCWGNGHRG